MNKNYFKKAISPVVATALLLVVVVVAVIGFQGWFQTFSSNLFSKTEIQSNVASQDGTLAIDTLIGNTLYVKNGVTDNLTIQSLKIGGIECNLTNQENLRLGMNEIDVANCLSNLTTSTPSVVLRTNNKILDKQFYVKGVTPASESGSSFADCSVVDGVQLNHTQSYFFANASSGFSACYYEERTCTDGVLNGTSTFNLATCASYYDLSCTTDLDGD